MSILHRVPYRILLRLVIPAGLLLLFVVTAASAQEKLGSYVGTAAISGTTPAPGKPARERVAYRATLKLTLPVTRRDRRPEQVVMEQFGEPPLATASALISQWDVTGKDEYRGEGGVLVSTSWTCTLAAPTEVPLSVHGVFLVNVSERTQEAFMTLMSIPDKTIPLTCNHSRTGPYKEDKSLSLFFGTSEGSLAPYKTQPAPDPSRLTAKFTYEPVAEMKGQEGPIALEWDLKLVR